MRWLLSLTAFVCVGVLLACGGPPPEVDSDPPARSPTTPDQLPKPAWSPAEVAALNPPDPSQPSVAWPQGAQPPRRISVNGRDVNPQEMAVIQQMERQGNFRVPDGSYWYDNASGLWGTWGGPALGWMPAGLGLGGAMPSHCSGGGTGVFINGRELHPVDVAALQRVMQVIPGRFWLDAQGNGGPEGGPAAFNLIALAQRTGAGSTQGGPWSHGTWTPEGNAWVGGDGQGFTYFMGPDGTSVYVDH